MAQGLPDLYRIYFQWWDAKRDDSIASVKNIIAQDPADDFKQLLAAMLTQQQKYSDAIPVLESMSARYGPDYIHTQMLLLHVARMAKDNDAGQRAGLRLIALRLPQQEQMQIMDDLRNVGLKDKADAMMAQQQGRGPGAAINHVAQAGNQLGQSLNAAVNSGNETLTLDLAHQILNRDPLAPITYGNEIYLRREALEGLKKIGKLDDYAQGIMNQLQAAPDSVKLNWLAAEAYQNMDGHVEKTVGLGPLPQWLKLTRKGNTLEGFYSFDGVNWISDRTAILNLPDKAYVGLWLSPGRIGAAQVTVDKIDREGSWSMADSLPRKESPPDAITAPLNGSTNFANPVIPPTPPSPAVASGLPGLWQQTGHWRGDNSWFRAQ